MDCTSPSPCPVEAFGLCIGLDIRGSVTAEHRGERVVEIGFSLVEACLRERGIGLIKVLSLYPRHKLAFRPLQCQVQSHYKGAFSFPQGWALK